MMAMRTGLWAAIMLAIAGAAAADPLPEDPGYHMVGTVALPEGALGTPALDLRTRQMLIPESTGVAAYDLDMQTVTPAFLAGQNYSSVAALGTTGDDAATSRSPGSSVLFDGKTGKEVMAFHTGAAPDASLFDAKSGLLVVVNGGEATIIDPVKRTVTGTVTLAGKTAPVLAGDDQGTVYAAAADGKLIEVLDPAAKSVTRRMALTGCGGVTGIAYLGDSDSLVVACANEVARFVTAAAAADLGTVALGKRPGAVLHDRDRDRVLVPCNGSLVVIALDPNGAGQIAQHLPIPDGIRQGVIDPVTGRVFLLVPAAGTGGNTLLVVDPA